MSICSFTIGLFARSTKVKLLKIRINNEHSLIKVLLWKDIDTENDITDKANIKEWINILVAAHHPGEINLTSYKLGLINIIFFTSD